MTFTKAHIAGFAAGFVVSWVVGTIKVKRPGWLISDDMRTRLSKKESAAYINDLNEEREIFFDLLLNPGKDPEELWEAMRFRGLTDERWMQVYIELERQWRNS